MKMNVKSMVGEWLEQNGYSGLFEEGFECGCEISDLMPCDMPCDKCSPGYKVICPKGHEYDFMIVADKNNKD